MAAPFQDPVAGSPVVLPAADVRGWNAAARDFIARKNNVRHDARGGEASSTIIKVQNASGSLVSRFGVMVARTPLIEPADNESNAFANPCIKSYTPGDPATGEAVVIAAETLNTDSIGTAVIAGATWAYILVASGQESYKWADVSNGVTSYLVPKSSGGPVRILWKESGTGTKKAYVLVGGHGPEWVYVSKTTDYTGSAGEHVSYDISGASRTFTFPASPTVGDKLRVGLNAGASPNLLTLDGNGNNVEGGSRTLSDANCYFAWREFRYLGGTVGWSSNSPIT